jgi:hypothetical protein
VQLLVEDITEHRVRHGRCPADDLADDLTEPGVGRRNGTRPRGLNGGQPL